MKQTNEYFRARRQKASAAGLCSSCAVRPKSKGQRCEECRIESLSTRPYILKRIKGAEQVILGATNDLAYWKLRAIEKGIV